ncbi:helix-turn-helix domain-containing protein [Ancylobacter mangrovi]|uniref:helix-turn-helix domain-containing protein n=1 Tax=Ancylobacter mangrovi TaxID=2972472 RepID=UPI002162ACC7|nr:helix-turn-helix domain-containing protein [Ancylobacter mangrovi]MCS0503366.1 helix-turn-helix domain-containing protein [Ancylobacter mangrovi]
MGRTAEKVATPLDGDPLPGEAIKKLRLARGISLNELARASEVSGGTLSQIERGRVSPSMRTLTKLRTALGVSLQELFSEAPAPSPAPADFVRRVDERNTIDLGKGLMVKEFICPPGMGDLMVMELVIEPGNGSGEEPYSYPGEKAGMVLDGSLSLEVDGRVALLSSGDGFQFNAASPHRLSNPGSTTTRVLWIISPHVPTRSI